MYVHLPYFKPQSCSDGKGINKRLSNLCDCEKVIKKGIIKVGQLHLSRVIKKVNLLSCCTSYTERQIAKCHVVLSEADAKEMYLKVDGCPELLTFVRKIFCHSNILVTVIVMVA